MALDHVDDTFEGAVVVGARFGIGMDGDGACPEFFGTYARKVDRGLSVHAGRGGHIAIELIAWHHPHTIVFPRCDAIGFEFMVIAVRHKFS
jgi:hypothetical protein